MSDLHELPWIRARTYNALMRAGFTTIEKLREGMTHEAAVKGDHICDYYGIGWNTYDDLVEALAAYDAGVGKRWYYYDHDQRKVCSVAPGERDGTHFLDPHLTIPIRKTG